MPNLLSYAIASLGIRLRSNPSYYIKPTEIESMAVIEGLVVLGGTPIEMKPAKFQPLDF